MSSKDQFLKIFVGGTIHVSKKDYSFFYNLSNIVKQKGSITTNQSKLFDKLVVKYQRQLRKNGYDIQTILDSEWETVVTQTEQEYLDAQINFTDGFIIVKTPYKSEFIKFFRKYVVDDLIDSQKQYINPFSWDKTEKVYKAKFSTIAMKVATSYTKKHFENVLICDELKNVLDLVDAYSDVKIWNPTYVKVNGNYYVAATNEVLQGLLDSSEFSDDPKFLYKLSKLGIKVEEDIVKDDATLRLASEYINVQSLDMIDQVIPDLKKIGIKNILFSRDLYYQKPISTMIKIKAESIGLEVHVSENNEKNIADEFVYMTLKSSPIKESSASKIMILKNNNPITVK